MRKKYVLILLILCSLPCFCQDSSRTKHGLNFSIGLTASPVWNYMKDEKDNFNLSAGILTFINFDNWVELNTGILLDSKKYSVIEYKYIYLSPSEKEKAIERSYSFQYFRLPAIVNFYFIRKMSIKLFSSAGIIWGFPLYRDSGFVNLRSIDYAGQSNNIFHLGLGIKYPLNDKISITVEPFFNHFIYPIMQEYTIRECPPYPFPCGPGYYSVSKRYIDSVNSREFFGTHFILNY